MTVAEAVNVFEKKPEVKVLRKFGKKKKVQIETEQRESQDSKMS